MQEACVHQPRNSQCNRWSLRGIYVNNARRAGVAQNRNDRLAIGSNQAERVHLEIPLPRHRAAIDGIPTPQLLIRGYRDQLIASAEKRGTDNPASMRQSQERLHLPRDLPDNCRIVIGRCHHARPVGVEGNAVDAVVMAKRAARTWQRSRRRIRREPHAREISLKDIEVSVVEPNGQTPFGGERKSVDVIRKV